ncbi:hypothetical protein [Paraburkholderia strydomiana]|uniref:hypothetical protein n=1 Tax=Paraburkholderia strydomiana TaxID=1245417 RepID=UPI00285FB914|nr:hypothetical protein [Paraburkholderia strydomiana]MDR7009600.1 hypothetical protein [Paraburkholderia strydomiana]
MIVSADLEAPAFTGASDLVMSTLVMPDTPSFVGVEVVVELWTASIDFCKSSKSRARFACVAPSVGPLACAHTDSGSIASAIITCLFMISPVWSRLEVLWAGPQQWHIPIPNLAALGTDGFWAAMTPTAQSQACGQQGEIQMRAEEDSSMLLASSAEAFSIKHKGDEPNLYVKLRKP